MPRGDRISVDKRAKLLAVYADTGNIVMAAKAAGVCETTASGYIRDHTDEVAQTKKAAAERMQEYIDSRLDRVTLAVDQILDTLPDKLDKANALQAATVLGILMDKFGGQRDFNGNAVQVNVTFGNKAGDMDAFK